MSEVKLLAASVVPTVILSTVIGYSLMAAEMDRAQKERAISKQEREDVAERNFIHWIGTSRDVSWVWWEPGFSVIDGKECKGGLVREHGEMRAFCCTTDPKSNLPCIEVCR